MICILIGHRFASPQRRHREADDWHSMCLRCGAAWKWDASFYEATLSPPMSYVRQRYSEGRQRVPRWMWLLRKWPKREADEP